MSTLKLQKKPVTNDWHPADVIAALRKTGWSLQQLALHHGYSGRSALSKALAEPYPKAETIIAEALGVPAMKIWPSRYNADGTSNRIPGSKPMRPDHVTSLDKATTGRRAGNLQNAEAR